MNNYKIPKTEIELLKNAIQKIITTEVLEQSIIDKLPVIDKLTDSNKIYQGKASMLFVDIRQSSKLPNKYSVEQLVMQRGFPTSTFLQRYLTSFPQVEVQANAGKVELIKQSFPTIQIMRLKT